MPFSSLFTHEFFRTCLWRLDRMMRLSSLSGSRRQLPPPAIASTSQAANVHRGGDHGGSGEAVERHEITDSECCARMFIDGGRNRRRGFG